jgi:hypothetical protein
MQIPLDRILSPNLGCPVIIPPEELRMEGIDLVTAEEEDHPEGRLSLVARPSYAHEGRPFEMELKGREELTEGTLPSAFKRIEETRFLISTALRSWIIGGKVRFFRYRAKITSSIGDEGLRRAGDRPRPTLYDLLLTKTGRRSYDLPCFMSSAYGRTPEVYPSHRSACEPAQRSV